MAKDHINQVPKPTLLGRSKSKLQTFLEKRYNIIASLKLSSVSVVLFLLLEYPQWFLSLANFRQRWYGVAIIGVYLFVSLVLTFFTRWTFKRKFNVWIQSNLLFVFSIIYYLRLSSETFIFFGSSVDSGLILIPLCILILLVNSRLFNRSFLREYLLILEVALYSITTFSVVSLLDIRDLIASQNGVLDAFLRVPDLVWIIFGSLSLALITALNTGDRKLREVALWFGGFGAFSLQVMWLLSFLNLSYWYQALIYLIFWDYLYNAARAIAHRESELNFYTKLMISTVYHILLMGVVVYFGTLYL